MIGSLSGTLAAREPNAILVETQGGVGYEVRVAPRMLAALPAVGEPVRLSVHTQVSQDAITLYGFTESADRRVFRLVQTVTGIGPKLALAIVGTVEPEALARAIAGDDIVGLSKIPGLGKKTAARLCLELKDKLARLFAPSPLAAVAAPLPGSESQATQDARDALAALGYNGREIKKALAAAAPTDQDTVQSVLRRALKALSPA